MAGHHRRPAKGRVLRAVLFGLLAGLIATLLWPSRRPVGLRIARCPTHGVSYDVDLEVCPGCATG
ncbi:MAG TPA: hypothetical protein VFN71_12230 [Methylomirabilota bacterium]|nr:hypothetical protein [Methylomirabilota bacterium]